jgi:hypothetical protein
MPEDKALQWNGSESGGYRAGGSPCNAPVQTTYLRAVSKLARIVAGTSKFESIPRGVAGTLWQMSIIDPLDSMAVRLERLHIFNEQKSQTLQLEFPDRLTFVAG